MDKENRQQELYTSPEVKVIEVRARQVMCQSTTSMPVDETFDF